MHDSYVNPLTTRYASQDMLYCFSDDKKFTTWRRLWIALAKAQKELGIAITQQQIDQLEQFSGRINYDVAEAREKEVRHDVMAHVYAYGEQCPDAKPIIHLGATSCYVGDNTDVMVMAEAMDIVKKKLVNCIDLLASFAIQYKDMPALAFTHFQPAQPTTVGKRACLWIQDLLTDYEDLLHVMDTIKLLGVKGTTGSQASFMTLFEGDSEKVQRLDELVCENIGFKGGVFPVTGQTYPRKQDSRVLDVLSRIAQSAFKFSGDIRLLQNLKEIEEPFEKHQIGSSAMAYKRNPMRTERMSSLARYVLSLPINTAITASTQWFERTLDDSANRRITIAQAFLAVDAILNIYLNVVDGLVVYPKMIHKRLMEELPFMATETILMEAVKRGGDRQDLHERIRVHSMEAGKAVKEQGKANDLIQRIEDDPAFLLSKEEIERILDPALFTGRCSEQVDAFMQTYIQPILKANADLLGEKGEVNV
ncbi:MAG: adenylosuccinate lyase [Christensenellales bacterium]|jgi:adenylosuccinate lyase